jgi:DNA-binding transcriptional ArsR family regulator
MKLRRAGAGAVGGSSHHPARIRDVRMARRAPDPSPIRTILLTGLGALDNDRRLQILDWLKEPTKHFRPQVDGDLVKDGVCGLLIAEKLEISQPTVSEHMRVLVAAGLVTARRVKQWTFYKRNEPAIAAFKRTLRGAL